MVPIHTLVLLGIEPSTFGIHLPLAKYHPYTFNGVKFLYADAPAALGNLPGQEKVRLVESLKAVFYAKD